MKKTSIAFICAIVLALPAAARNVGGGVSVWVPESLYLAQDGSVGVETAIGSSMGMGDFLSLPFGIVYNQVYAMMPEIGGAVGSRPWFYADTVVGFAGAKVRLPAGPVYVDLFGGIAGVWNVTLVPLVKNIEAGIAPAGHLVTFQDEITINGGRFGWGWQAGGGLGIRIDRISVDLNVTYRLLSSAATITGTSTDLMGGIATVDQSYSEDLGIRLGGLSIGIDASYEL